MDAIMRFGDVLEVERKPTVKRCFEQSSVVSPKETETQKTK